MTSPDPRPQTRPTPAGGPAYWDSLTNPHRFTKTIAGAVTTGVGKASFTNDTGQTLRILSVELVAGTAPVGADLIVDVNVEGTSQFTAASRPRIVAGQTAGSAVPADNPGDQALVAPGEDFTVDVDQVGSGTAGSDLTVSVVAAEYAANGLHWKDLRDGLVREQIRDAELLPLDVNPA